LTEPLFLALMLWSTVVAVEAAQALAANRIAAARVRLVVSGLLTFLMVFTRYDGWVLGAVIWVVLTLAWWRSAAGTRRATQVAFLVMTVLVIAGPLLWFTYNAVYEGDWLDFMRGPYSAAAIEKKTTPPGSKPYRGWHNPGWALWFYSRAAQVDAVAYELGFVVLAAALAGAWMLWKQRLLRIALLLWVPLPFYVYSVAWSHVPIFIPQLYPHSYYNSRYGIEMLPAFAIFAAIALVAVERRLRAKSVKWADAFFLVVLASIVLNMIAMTGMFGTMLGRVIGNDAKVPKWLSAPPLVYEEGVVNSSTRIPFEKTIAKEILNFGTHQVIMFDTTDHIGAIQIAGIDLKRLVSPLDSQSFDQAKPYPAKYANLIVAIDGDPVAKAVAANKDGLEELEVVCNSGQGCARFYRSHVMTEVPR
jgi:hypothetical protein